MEEAVPNLRPDWRANLKDVMLVITAGAAIIGVISHMPSAESQKQVEKAVAAIEQNVAVLRSDVAGHNNTVDVQLKNFEKTLDRIETDGVPRKRKD